MLTTRINWGYLRLSTRTIVFAALPYPNKTPRQIMLRSTTVRWQEASGHQTLQKYMGERVFTSRDLHRMDTQTKLMELKAKRRAVEDAIAALQHLKAEYRDRRSLQSNLPPRRAAAADKPASPRKIA